MKKFDDDKVIEVYLAEGSIEELTHRFDMDIRTIRNIKARMTYKNITQALDEPGEIFLHSLSWPDIEIIRNSTDTAKNLADQFNVNPETIHNIRSRKTRFFR